MAKILVVDDSLTLTTMFQRYFARDGHAVFVAAKGREGIESARSERPDLILLDHILPDMDGFDVCREIRADAANASSRILILTGSTEESLVAKSREVGADAFLTKDGGLAKVFEIAGTLLEDGVAP